MNIVFKAAMAGAVAGTLALGATPSLAQIVLDFSPGPYVYVVPGPAPYAYWPAYRYSRGAPAGYDTGGAPYYYDELGWQPGWRGGAPANPCWSGQRSQNRC